MPKECLEGKAHIWIFPPGEGKEVSNGPHSGGHQKAFTKYTKIVVEKQNKATCSICNQTNYTSYEVNSSNRNKKWGSYKSEQERQLLDYTGKKRRGPQASVRWQELKKTQMEWKKRFKEKK